MQAQFRKFEHLTDNSTRGNFTFNGIFTGNSVADYLLGYCSTCAGAFGASAATYNSPTIAPFIDDNWQVSDKLNLQLGLRWEYLAPWAEQNGVEAAFDAATGKIGYNALPTSMPAALVPLVHQQEGFFPDGILKKDLNNFGPRVGVAYNLTDRMVLRSGFGVYYDNLNLNELQFTRLIPPYYGQFSLNPPATAPLQVDTLFPDLNNIPQFPAPFSLDPANRTPYTLQWNVNLQRSLGQDYLFEAAYTGSRSRSLSKRYNINQADFGTTPINSRLPFPQFQPAILYSAAIGTADFKGLSLRFEKRYSAGLFFLANYQLSENRDNGSGEVEANDTAFRTDFDADESLSRYHQRHRGAFSFGYELPFGKGRHWLNSGGAVAYVLGEWQVQGVVRAGSGFPFTLSGTNVCQCGSFVPQRVNDAPGREGGGALDNPTVDAVVRQDGLRTAGSGIPGHGRPQYLDRTELEVGGFFHEQAFPTRRVASRIPMGHLQFVQHDELRTAGRQHQQRHRWRHLDGGRCPEHAVRDSVRVVRSKDVTAYIAGLPAPARAALTRVRSIIRRAVPAAEEMISYQIPAYKLHGRPVLFFAAWKEHYLALPVERAPRRHVQESAVEVRDLERDDSISAVRRRAGDADRTHCEISLQAGDGERQGEGRRTQETLTAPVS